MTCPKVARPDYRDHVIEHLADQEHTLAHDLAAVRELLHLALEQLHETGRHCDRLREQHRQLRDEYRRLRELILRDERRAA